MVDLAKLILLMLMLTGCQSTTHEPVVEINKNSIKLMEEAGNYQGLISLYKKMLSEGDGEESRYLLAEAYYLSGDMESAQYHLQILTTKQKVSPEVYLLLAHVNYNLNAFNAAKDNVENAIALNPRYGEAFNLKGLIFAETDGIREARSAFEIARSLLYDDVSVKNNLAVLDMIEGNYSKALSRLTPLYVNGQADDKVKANLVIAAVKAGRADVFRMLLKQKKDENQILELYQALRRMEIEG
ncbi:hypothetical protein NF212_11410 [Parasalinivibrio latis]|uniref:tetratricopeptide repeat protein n=1 Tax=Parasalinivibrio latis TaxID=2952610 RepID=UPI0030DF1576